ncbi:MAG: 16S rRNA (cytosine(967)-C(5))-methyltransferase RsmB [Alphaproteobacteria bacterium]
MKQFSHPPRRSSEKKSSPSANNRSSQGNQAGLLSRLLVVEVLEEVLNNQQLLDQAMENNPLFARLAPRDRAFARRAIMMVLRRLREIDHLLAGLLDNPAKLSKNGVFHLLRLGLAELLFLETPPHAAVASAVALAEKMGHSHLKGLVNAVLRRVDREKPPIASAADAGKRNTPEWLWQSWVKAYGEEAAKKIVEAHTQEPPTDFTILHGDIENWAQQLEAEIMLPHLLRRQNSGMIHELPGYENGAWLVQDAAASLGVSLLGNLQGKTVLDLCAAPGGKTAQLIQAGATVTAVEKSPARMNILRQNMARLQMKPILKQEDALNITTTTLFDVVLLDAPCSATGTIRRHTDILYIREQQDIKKMADLQIKLLAHAAKMVKIGGELIYMTCSLQPEEGEDIISQFLQQNNDSGHDFRLKKWEIENLTFLKDCVKQDGMIRTLPSLWHEKGGMDGFFMCRLQKTR